MAGNYLRGAFIQYNNSFPIPVPNLILFQYNPETMTHTWTPAQAGGSNSAGQSPSNPLAVIGPPEEAFSFDLVMDSNDTIADNNPGVAQLAEVSGSIRGWPRSRCFSFPLLPRTVASLARSPPPSAQSEAPWESPQQQPCLPETFQSCSSSGARPHCTGPRETLTVTETLYDSLTLNPVHASAQLGLKVLHRT